MRRQPDKSELVSRDRRAVVDSGQIRLPVKNWRELGKPDELTCDFVRLPDGTLEVRLHD